MTHTPGDDTGVTPRRQLGRAGSLPGSLTGVTAAASGSIHSSSTPPNSARRSADRPVIADSSEVFDPSSFIGASRTPE